MWLWVVLAAVAVIGLVALIVSVSRRGAAKADWNSRLIDAYARGSALHDAMAAAETPGVPGSGEATARWFDIQRRADDYGQLLYALQESAPNEEDRLRLADVLASLQAVRTAMDAERSGQRYPGTMSNVVRDRLAYFMASLQELRDPYVHPA
ncbi:MAG: hypothetical protein JO132_14165 [Streptosporangiaceae bacterium]|nr:hypothetical protein [Streptosporangiaceae bacterium]